VLSRSLAEAGHFPAIDVALSASRVMHNVVTREHFEAARHFRAIGSHFEKGRDLVQIGAYVHGSDAALDEAIRLHDPMMEFLRQDMYAAASLEESVQRLTETIRREEAFP
jgi:flagellum-specific ATP synthase